MVDSQDQCEAVVQEFSSSHTQGSDIAHASLSSAHAVVLVDLKAHAEVRDSVPYLSRLLFVRPCQLRVPIVTPEDRVVADGGQGAS